MTVEPGAAADSLLETYRALADAAEDAVAIHDGTFVVAVNAACCRMHGLAEAEILGRPFLDFVAPEAREEVLARARAGDPGPYEAMERRGDGSVFPVEYLIRPVTFRGRPARAVCIRDLTQAKRAQEALTRSREQMSAMFAQATVGISQTDLEGRFVLVNDRFCDLVGRPREALLRLHVADITHPGDLARNLALFRQGVAAGDPYMIEKRYLRPDGEAVWVDISVTPLRDEEGRVHGMLGVSIDVSARKASEERQRLLMREVDHRAKNVLAVVQALVRLTRADTREEFVRAVEDRVGALARTHALLAQSQWSAVDLRLLLEAEMAAYQSAAGQPGGSQPTGSQAGERRVTVRGAPVSIAADAVQPLGLLLHELATNAAKHGALSVPSGRVEIAWEPEPGGMALLWTETGGPRLAAAPQGDGFGSTLIATSVRHQLSGTVHLDWRREGLRCTVRLPSRWFAAGTASGRGAAAAPAPGPLAGLEGRRVLAVEDDAILALTVKQALAEQGCRVVGPAPTLGEALRLASTAEIDAAVLDVNLRGRTVYAVAEVLTERGVPFLFTTGYDRVDWDARVPV
ncbi:MAG TPA: PAS domain S-box protein, partial [Azospirillaceae bacterium]|nr:PAS domain S-box protein [Azospirillaceae bacterium]